MCTLSALSMLIAVASACSNSTAALKPLTSATAASTATSVGVADIAPNGAGGALGTIPPSGPQFTADATTTAPPTATPTSDISAGTAGACTFDAIHASVGEAPAGITDIDLRCHGEWASWVGQANDPTASDGYFAVARRSATGWETTNLGTAGVCSDGGVPQELWTDLNCTE
ncbi:MAG: hypothetical protein F2789_09760 [Actinobacteria bacterium]|nr:hypothetical protein [Actinomycetota bacterium]